MSEAIKNRKNERGLFIVFEGLDGSGTTTQAAELASWLSEHGIPAESTYEPSTGPIGGLTRSVTDGRLDMEPAALALMFAGDRVDHLYNKSHGLVPLLEEGFAVISDRYVLSSLAYQAIQGLSVDWLLEINAHAIVPDVTIFLDADVHVCLQRISRRSVKTELFHEQNKLEQVERAYRNVLSRGEFIGNLVTADGTQDIPSVSKQVQEGLINLAERRQLPALNRLLDAVSPSPQVPRSRSYKDRASLVK